MLLQTYLAAVRQANELSEQQLAAAVTGDSSLTQFDVLIEYATELRLAAKRAFMRHVEEHGCLCRDSDLDV
jgi:hypothetical protein